MGSRVYWSYAARDATTTKAALNACTNRHAISASMDEANRKVNSAIRTVVLLLKQSIIGPAKS